MVEIVFIGRFSVITPKYTLFSLFLFFLGSLSLLGRMDIRPLGEIEAGMKGIWKTVVTGVEIESFELEILGTAPNFIGPQEPIILARVIDPENVLSGPVAGMSGSPVYIDGRLIGAYAYGYTWPKEQGIIGITPIERMLPLLGEELSPALVAGGGNRSIGEGRSVDSEEELKPLPTPLAVSGISPATFSVFRPKLERWGLEPMRSPSGGVDLPEDFRFEPGSAMAAVLMTGDFSAAATGTVTWSDGEQVIGFGHPFMRLGGDLAVPFSGAHVFTVVRNVQRSFKLSTPGPVVGTIFTDRLPGVAARVGPIPDMAHMRIDLTTGLDTRRQFSTDIFPHPDLLPLLSAMALLESLTQLVEAHPEQTIRMRTVVRSRQVDPIEVRSTVSGWDSPTRAALEFLDSFDRFLNNTIEAVDVESIEVGLEVVDRLKWRTLEEVQIDRRRLRAGETVELDLVLRGYQDGGERIRVPVKIPQTVRNQTPLSIVVTDAEGADQLQLPRGSARSLEGLADRWRSRRDMGNLYVLLVADRQGVHIGDQALADPPPSVRNRLTADPAPQPRVTTEQQVLEEIVIPVDGIFWGENRIRLEWNSPSNGDSRPASTPFHHY